MVTKMLHTLGLYLGLESDLMPSNPNNPEGFWENKRFVRINAGILNQLGGAWDCPPPIPDDWTGGRLAAFRAEAEALLAEFSGREPWGWKDPRNCLTLPFWQEILGPPRVVLVVRNPLEVAQSLRKRNGFSYALGLTLWQTHNQRLCDAVAPRDRIVTHYDMYRGDPGGELRRLATFLNLSIDEDVIDQVSAMHIAEMRHHQVTTQDLRKAEVASAILELYHDLCAEAHWQDSGRERAHTGETAPALLERWDDPDSPEFTGRPDRRPLKTGRPQLRRQLEEAEARIAELEQTVAAQRLALARFETAGRESITSSQQRSG